MYNPNPKLKHGGKVLPCWDKKTHEWIGESGQRSVLNESGESYEQWRKRIFQKGTTYDQQRV